MTPMILGSSGIRNQRGTNSDKFAGGHVAFSYRRFIVPSCIKTRAGVFTNLPFRGKVVATLGGCGRFNGRHSGISPALVTLGGFVPIENRSDLLPAFRG